MDIEAWFKDKKVLEKSKRRYVHFDLRTDFIKCKKYITNPKNIEHNDKINSIFLNRINSLSYLFSSITLLLNYSLTFSGTTFKNSFKS